MFYANVYRCLLHRSVVAVFIVFINAYFYLITIVPDTQNPRITNTDGTTCRFHPFTTVRATMGILFLPYLVTGINYFILVLNDKTYLNVNIANKSTRNLKKYGLLKYCWRIIIITNV